MEFVKSHELHANPRGDAKKRLHSKKKKKAKNVAAKGSRIITSLFPPALTTSTLSSPDQLIEYKRKYLFMPIKTFSVAF